MGAHEHAEPISLFRLSDGAAQPACWLRVPSVHPLRVCQRYAMRDARDLRRELPAARQATRCWHAREVLVRFGGSARRAHACDMRSEIVVVVCGSTSSTLWHAYRPFAEHAGGGRRSVQSKRAWVRSMSDFIVRLFGATQFDTVRKQHNTTYRRKNGTLIRERTLTGGPAACRRLADRAPWISSRISRSVGQGPESQLQVKTRGLNPANKCQKIL